jgi:hypothetical protein
VPHHGKRANSLKYIDKICKALSIRDPVHLVVKAMAYRAERVRTAFEVSMVGENR